MVKKVLPFAFLFSCVCFIFLSSESLRAASTNSAMADPATSNHVPRPVSPAPTVPLVEVVEDTRLVLRAFLRQSLATPLDQRPGRVGGAYKDPSKCSAKRNSPREGEDGWDSLDEQISAAEEKKHGIKDLIRRRLRRRPSKQQRSLKRDGPVQNGPVPNGSLERGVRSGLAELELSGKPDGVDRARRSQDNHESDRQSASSSSDEGTGKKERKKKKKKSPFSSFLSKFKSSKVEEAASAEPQPKRPDSLTLALGAEPEAAAASPARSPEFYNEVAETLEKIAQKHTANLSPAGPPPGTCETSDKDAVVRQLVQVLSMQGDAINEKIQMDPFLRSSLTRLSYPSFTKLLDTIANQAEEAPTPAAPASPTLTRVAVTMEVSRRVVTATGMQRMQGFAERYMTKFAPWVQSQGGWDNIAQLDEVSEYD